MSSMNGQLVQIDMVLARIELLAETLHQDPDQNVLRSANELRAAFCARLAIEPAVARVRAGLDILRLGNRDGAGRELTRRAQGVDHLVQVMEHELLPDLRRVGFDV